MIPFLIDVRVRLRRQRVERMLGRTVAHWKAEHARPGQRLLQHRGVRVPARPLSACRGLGQGRPEQALWPII